MQTFLPYPNFRESVQVLDTKRLGKQRVETLQIVRALTWPDYAWKSHPAVLMWKGFEEALVAYGLECCDAWLERGFGDTCAGTMLMDIAAAGIDSVRRQPELEQEQALPPWLGDERVHRSHQASLMRKDPTHYGAFFGDVPPDLPYFWPVRSEKVLAAERRKAERAAKAAERQS